MKKKFLSGILAFSMLFGLITPTPQTVSAAEAEPKEIVLEKSTLGNPIAGFDENGNNTYAGDPAILVDGDTVYLYVGHDYTGTGGGYTMPDYLCYSTKDLKEWKYEGVTMKMTDVAWADDASAWASQVIKYKDMYYLLYCAERKNGGKATAAAVSNSPTGPFKDVGILINPEDTNASGYTSVSGKPRGGSFGHEDIDPTAWIDTDENGKEHIYMVWGNTNCWMCELDIDGEKVVVKDQNGDGVIKQEDDIWWQDAGALEVIPANGTNKNDMVDFTEAPYLYRRQDDKGNYYGQYYLFFATHWREEMGYSTIDKLEPPSDGKPYNVWTYGGKLMEPTATSNTNHPAVFDFKGHTYFIYHNGSLPGGSGYRRVICIEELKFNEDGSINYIPETSSGISGSISRIFDSSKNPLAHDHYNNSLDDGIYPYKDVTVKPDANAEDADAFWEIEEGKANRNKESYVTIESYNKPGLYLMATENHKVVLAHDHNDNKACTADGITKDSDAMTFRTLEGFDKDVAGGVTFESVKYPGYYITSKNGELTVSENPAPAECTFAIGKASLSSLESVTAQKTVKTYEVGSEISLDDIRVRAKYENGTTLSHTEGLKIDASAVDTKTPGTKKINVTYKERGIEKTCSIDIKVRAKAGSITDTNVTPAKDLPKKNSTHTVKNLKYKVTKTDEYNTDGTNGTVSVVGIKSSKLTSVVIPDTVSIGGYTFKVKAIAAKAFYKKSKLKTITIGSNITSIGKNAITGINKKATIKVPSARYKAVKKLLTSKTGYKKTMKIKKV